MKDSRFLPFSLIVTGVVLLASSGISRAEEIPPMTKDNGPFMVLACSFRGPDAERLARTLALELRKSHDIPAFLYHEGSYVVVEKNPEFAVLVGNAKTPLEGKELQQRIRKLKPECFANTTYEKRGLTRAICTTNPLLGSQSCALPRSPKGPVNPH